MLIKVESWNIKRSCPNVLPWIALGRVNRKRIKDQCSSFQSFQNRWLYIFAGWQQRRWEVAWSSHQPPKSNVQFPDDERYPSNFSSSQQALWRSAFFKFKSHRHPERFPKLQAWYRIRPGHVLLSCYASHPSNKARRMLHQLFQPHTLQVWYSVRFLSSRSQISPQNI